MGDLDHFDMVVEAEMMHHDMFPWIFTRSKGPSLFADWPRGARLATGTVA